MWSRFFPEISICNRSCFETRLRNHAADASYLQRGASRWLGWTAKCTRSVQSHGCFRGHAQGLARTEHLPIPAPLYFAASLCSQPTGISQPPCTSGTPSTSEDPAHLYDYCDEVIAVWLHAFLVSQCVMYCPCDVCQACLPAVSFLSADFVC